MQRGKPGNWVIFAAVAGFALVGCKPTADTGGSKEVGNRGRTADAQYTEISGTNLTSTTASTVTVTLRSKGGIPLAGIVPTFTVSPLSANDFNFQCTASNSAGVSNCSFRSYDAGVTKTLQLTSPVVKTGNSVTVTRAASEIRVTTQPTSATVVNTNNSAVVQLFDPLGTQVTGDSSTVITATLTTVSNTNLSGLTPTLRVGGVACSPCTLTATAGEAQFAGANAIRVNTSGSYKLVFSAPGLTSGTSNTFTSVNDTAAQLIFTTQPSTSVAPNEIFPTQPIVSIADATGNLVTTGGCETNTVELSLVVAAGLGTGTLVGDVADSGSGGVVSYANNSLRIDRNAGTPNSYKINADDNPNCASGALTNAQSSTMTVSDVGIPAALQFSQQPSSATTTGTVIPRQPKVRVVDSSGNLVSNNQTLSITLSAGASCPGVVIGGTNPRTVVNGVATFTDITLTHAAPPQNCQITASAAGVTSALSSVSRVTAAGVTGAALQWVNQPTTAGKNQNILAAGPASLTVRVVDSGGNLVAGDNSTTVSISKTPTTGTLSGTVTTTVSAGVATFSDLKIDTVGAYALVASAAGLTSATSNSFVIDNSGVATSLLLSSSDGADVDTEPDDYDSTITAGTVFDRMPIVRVVDPNGALVSTADGIPVTIECSNPAGCSLIGFPTTVYTSGGIADFNVSGASLRINTPMGNNLAIRATATSASLNAGTTQGPIVGSPAAASNSTSSVSILCPSAAGVADGVAFVFVKDQFGNVRVGDAVTGAWTNACSGSCSTTDSTGKSTCSFSCPAAGTTTFSVTAPAAITSTATCGF